MPQSSSPYGCTAITVDVETDITGSFTLDCISDWGCVNGDILVIDSDTETGTAVIVNCHGAS